MTKTALILIGLGFVPFLFNLSMACYYSSIDLFYANQTGPLCILAILCVILSGVAVAILVVPAFTGILCVWCPIHLILVLFGQAPIDVPFWAHWAFWTA